jgi:hypothetical protein
MRVDFGPKSQVREIFGFTKCNLLYAIELPKSVEIMRGFEGSGLRQVRLTKSTAIQQIRKTKIIITTSPIGDSIDLKPDAIFLEYDESDLKKRRRGLCRPGVRPKYFLR